MNHNIIHKDPGAYSCFPAIAKNDKGTLFVTFRRAGGFSLKAVQQGKYDHVDKGARIAVSKSIDNGTSWEPAEILPMLDPECGEQDPSIAVLKNGNLLINFFQWRVVPEEEKSRLGYPARQQYDGSWADVEGPYVMRSTDDGASWGNETFPVPTHPLPHAGTSDALVELPNGDLIMGIYGANYGDNICRAYSVLSKDKGQTWGSPALMAEDPQHKISFEEPAICVTQDGRLLAMIRAGEPRKYQYLYKAFSDDMGKTWHDLTETPMWGHPAHVLKLADGRLVCTYGHRRPPYGIRACVSSDNGATWDIDHEIILRDDGHSRDLGYPCSVALQDDEILTVYYIHGEDLIRHIAATKWKVN
ncbi:MAG: exo-alpha-sialidase [Anaerolineaceae bacterium]|nr:exo-alpha-sialidase [Anaerolineaceae bacterium]